MQAMLVHPDKNMGSALASESFKKLQCAYEVITTLKANLSVNYCYNTIVASNLFEMQMYLYGFLILSFVFQVLSDSVKKRDYDEQLRKEQSRSVMQNSPSTSNQVQMSD